MSSAYKHLYSCVTFLIFILVINFYKNRVQVNREREASFRANTKLKRTGALNRPSPLEGTDGDDFLFDFAFLDEGFVDSWHWDRSKQYPGRCLDVEVFFVTPYYRPIPRRTIDGPEGLHYKSSVLTRKREPDPAENSVPNASIYVFLSVLLILLLAAGVDIAKHLSAIRRGPKEEAQRRLSLQNYQALIREKQKQFRMMKQHYSQPSISIQRSIDETSLPYVGFSRMEDASSGITGTFTPVKPGPAPLLRRQSVPVLMRGQVSSSTGCGLATMHPVAPFGRRTSVDSFWDTDHGVKGSTTPGNASPSEVRRRVRMLHRH